MKKSLCFCLIIFCFSCLFGNEFFYGDMNTPLEFSFQAYKNPSVTDEWKYSVTIIDKTHNQVISDTQKYSFEIGSDYLNEEKPLFSVAYKTNSVENPITFHIAITDLVNDDTQKSVDVKYKLDDINIEYSQSGNQNWPPEQDVVNSFVGKYANSKDGRIWINGNEHNWYFADATFSFDVYAVYANSEGFSSADDGTYRMNVAVTVEAEGL